MSLRQNIVIFYNHTNQNININTYGVSREPGGVKWVVSKLEVSIATPVLY